jgi:hypothetical protein
VPDHLQIIDWQAVKMVAEQQGVFGMLSCILKNKDQYPCDIVNAVKQSVLSSAIMYFRWQSINYDLLKELEANGLHPVVLKGMAVSRFYSLPEVRLSADMDILLSHNELDRAIAILMSKGYCGQPFHKGSMYHIEYTHPTLGMVELHADLYSDFMEEIWFNGVGRNDIIKESWDTITTEEGEYLSLGVTDHIIFLSLHLAKHFIASGLSLKLIMDIVLFASSNQIRIDTERYWSLMRQAHIGTLMEAIFTFANKHWSIDKQSLLNYNECNDELCDAILLDLFKGGAEGRLQQSERIKGWYIYYKEKILTGRDESQYSRLLFCNTILRHARNIFPGKQYLADKYHFIKNYPFLFPITWLYWLVTTGVRIIFHWKKNSFYVEDELNQVAKDRMDMFKKLKMI